MQINANNLKLLSEPIPKRGIRWFGGKILLAPKICSFLNQIPHSTYVEPFGGGFSVGIRKNSSNVEIYSDLLSEACHFWTTLRDRPKNLILAIHQSNFCDRAEFVLCHQENCAEPIERARRFYGKCLLSFVGGGVRYGGSSTARINGSDRNEMTDHSHLWSIAERIQNVKFLNQNAFDLIPQIDDSNALIYVDPPYVSETRNSHTPYIHDFSDEQHRELTSLLHKTKAKVAISGYKSDLYDNLFKNWRCETLNARSLNGKKRADLLWFSPNCR